MTQNIPVKHTGFLTNQHNNYYELIFTARVSKHTSALTGICSNQHNGLHEPMFTEHDSTQIQLSKMDIKPTNIKANMSDQHKPVKRTECN